jgi:hypothetical protein
MELQVVPVQLISQVHAAQATAHIARRRNFIKFCGLDLKRETRAKENQQTKITGL